MASKDVKQKPVAFNIKTALVNILCLYSDHGSHPEMGPNDTPRTLANIDSY
jgi:hypothetical protein